jgi:hypothetical protein
LIYSTILVLLYSSTAVVVGGKLGLEILKFFQKNKNIEKNYKNLANWQIGKIGGFCKGF